MKLYLNIRFSRFAGGWLIPLLSLFLTSTVSAAGIKDIAPTAADSPVMLETGRAGFGSFADFNSEPEGRLYISFGRADEVLYLGLSPEYSNDGETFNTAAFSEYRFRIRRDNPGGDDPIVHGPFTVTNFNANVGNYDMAEYGMYPTTAVNAAGDSLYVFRPGVAGDFYIEFDDAPRNDGDVRVNIPFWDLTVVRDAQVIPGRVWSRGWAFRTPQVTGTTPPDCVWDREFNGQLFSYTEDGFVSLIDFEDSGLQGLSFNIAFNSTGPGTSGDLGDDRMSVPNLNQTTNARQHRIFLSLPDIEIFPDGVCGSVTAGSSFVCGGDDPYCLQVDVSRAGQVEILLDFDGNGVLDDNSQDVNLVYDFSPDALSECIPWDGLRGDGTAVDFTDTVDVIITYSQGVQHWSAYDVEFMKNGFCVETVRPICTQTLSSNNLYHDDRNIPEDPGTGAPKDNREGCACGDGCRTWDNFALNPGGNCNTFNDAETSGYGDKSTLNTWWFANSQSQFRARVPVVSASITGPTILCEGQASALLATDAGVEGEPTFLWSGPNVDGLTTATVEVTEAGEYCVTIFDPSGCSNQTCISLEVANFDDNPFPSGLDICFGDDIQAPVAGNTAYTYVWSPATGIDDVNSNQPTFNPLETTTYSVEITSDNGTGEICQTTEEITVSVAADLNLQVIGGGPICNAQTTFSATTAVASTVVLFDDNGMQIGTGTEFTVDVSGDTDYVLVATADGPLGCTDTVTFSVSGGPVDISLPDTVINCTTEGVALSVTNIDENDNLSYVWAPADLFDPATINNANPTFIGAPGDYAVTVTVTNQYDCETTEEVRVVLINDDGALSFTPTTDCDGATVRFANTSTVDFGYLYDFGDGTTSTDPNPVHVYDMTGTYTVTLSMNYDQDCVASFTQEITIFESTLDAGFAIGLDDCDNGSATLNFTDASFNATGTDLTYGWTFTGATPATSMEANPTLTITESGTVTASLMVSSADGCSSTVDTSFTVDLAIVNLVEEIIICPGESAELNPGGSTDLSYTWSPATDFDPNAVNPTTNVPGQYIVMVSTDAADFNCSNVDTINVILADSIGLVISGPDGPLNGGDGGNGGGNGNEIELPTVTTCGNAVDLSVDVMTTAGTDITYTDLDGNVLGMGGTITLNPDGRDTVVITAVSEFGCIERDTVVLINNQVNAGIDVGTGDLNVCASVDTTLSIVNFDSNDTLTYAWGANPIIVGSLINQTVNIISPAEGSVDVFVTVTNQLGCDTMMMITVTSTPFTPNQYEDAIQPCFEDEFTITGGAVVDGYTYEWEPSENLDLSDPANPVGTFNMDGQLMVTITDPMTGCSETQTIMVDVQPEISFMANPQDTVLCSPGNVTVGGTSVNENVEIVWYDDEALMNQVGTGPTFVVEGAEPGQTYTVYGEATDPTTGCSQVVPVTVTVSEITAGLPLENIVTCAGDGPSIFAPGGFSSTLDYRFEPADLVDLSDSGNPIFTGTESTTITVTATDPATGCSVTSEVVIDVTDLGGLTGMADPEMILLGESSTLSVEGCDDCTYDWMPPNGTVTPGDGSTVVATPDEAGELVYEVIVSRNGCTEVVEIILVVEDPLCDVDHVYVPNAFTPNRDGKNDEMRVRSNFIDQLTEFQWIIYNRWGQEVYNSTDPEGFWDGTQEGDDLEPDVYGYWLRVRCPATDEPLIQQGNITILR